MEQTISIIEGEVRALSDNVEETRTVTFVASTSTKDRHGTVLNQKNWNIKNFNSNPIIGYQHNVYGGDMCNAPDPDDQLGSARAYLETVKRGEEEEEQLMVDITFEPAEINPKAEKIFRKVLHGSLRAVSVGFSPMRNDDGKTGEMRDGTFHYFGQELLEVSVVNIPSNPDALKRSFRDSTANALSYISRSLNKTFGDIENMTIREVLDSLDGKESIVEEPVVEEPIEKKNAKTRTYRENVLILKSKSHR
jgi:HK97 family phage prohead protease